MSTLLTKYTWTRDELLTVVEHLEKMESNPFSTSRDALGELSARVREAIWNKIWENPEWKSVTPLTSAILKYVEEENSRVLKENTERTNDSGQEEEKKDTDDRPHLTPSYDFLNNRGYLRTPASQETPRGLNQNFKRVVKRESKVDIGSNATPEGSRVQKELSFHDDHDLPEEIVQFPRLNQGGTKKEQGQVTRLAFAQRVSQDPETNMWVDWAYIKLYTEKGPPGSGLDTNGWPFDSAIRRDDSTHYLQLTQYFHHALAGVLLDTMKLVQGGLPDGAQAVSLKELLGVCFSNLGTYIRTRLTLNAQRGNRSRAFAIGVMRSTLASMIETVIATRIIDLERRTQTRLDKQRRRMKVEGADQVRGGL